MQRSISKLSSKKSLKKSSICKKNLEKLIFDEMCSFYIENEVNHCGSRSWDLCVNQFSLITYDIYKSFNN